MLWVSLYMDLHLLPGHGFSQDIQIASLPPPVSKPGSTYHTSLILCAPSNKVYVDCTSLLITNSLDEQTGEGAGEGIQRKAGTAT